MSPRWRRGRGLVGLPDRPAEEAYGTVAVFTDLYGNLWDLVQHSADPSEQHKVS
jgi:hypothetical protein